MSDHRKGRFQSLGFGQRTNRGTSTAGSVATEPNVLLYIQPLYLSGFGESSVWLSQSREKSGWFLPQRDGGALVSLSPERGAGWSCASSDIPSPGGREHGAPPIEQMWENLARTWACWEQHRYLAPWMAAGERYHDSLDIALSLLLFVCFLS